MVVNMSIEDPRK